MTRPHRLTTSPTAPTPARGAPTRARARTQALGALLAAGTLTLTAACGGSSDAAEPRTSIGTDATLPPFQLPSDEPQPLTAEEQAIADVEQAVREYYEVDFDVQSDPTADPARLEDVAAGEGLAATLVNLNFERDRGSRISGSQSIPRISVTDVDLSSERPGGPLVAVETCRDVSDVQVLNQAGESLVEPDRPDVVLERLTLNNAAYPDPEGWKVTAYESRLETCSDLA